MKKLFLLLVTTAILFSCGDSENPSLNSDDSNYKYVYSSGYDFNDSLFAIINNIQEVEKEFFLQENTGEDMEQIRQKVSTMLVEGIEKTEQTKPYYEGEDLKKEVLVLLRLKQKHIDNNWVNICKLVGNTKVVDVSDEVFNQIEIAVNKIDSAEELESNNLATVQNIFAVSLGTHVETPN